jgi:septum site-determining protein MinC
MAVVPKPNASAVFDLKGAALTLVAVVLRTADLVLLAEAMRQRFADTPFLFHHDPVVIDLAALRDDDAAIDFAALSALLREHRMMPIAVRGGSAAQMDAALAAGLGEAPDVPAARPPAPPVLQEVVTELIPDVPVPARTMIVDRPLRSGQQVYARGGDLVVLAVVNFGAEVIADGHVHVYAPLRGRAIAGARGDAGARILTTCLEAPLVSIAGFYRTTENGWPADVAGKAAQIRLDGERIVVEPLKP